MKICALKLLSESFAVSVSKLQAITQHLIAWLSNTAHGL